jgi:hypothetical protein
MQVELLGTVQVRDDGGSPAHVGGPRARALLALLALDAGRVVSAASLLDTIRAYCQERLAQAGEEDGIRDRMCGYYLALAETADPLLRARAPRHWFGVLAAESDNGRRSRRAGAAPADRVRRDAGDEVRRRGRARAGAARPLPRLSRPLDRRRSPAAERGHPA